MRMQSCLRLLLLPVLAASLAGCTSSTTGITGLETTKQISGNLHGGQQPVQGATIQVYAVGTSGAGSAATPLLAPPVTTGPDGGFSLAAFSCPATSTLIYLVATGGDPGFSNGSSNPQLSMMTAIGPCGSLTPSSFLFVNELTTVASIAALAPYAVNSTSIGSAPAQATQLANAFTLVSQYTDTTSGTVPGTSLPSGFYASSSEIATLANILSICINSAGGVAGDSSPCGVLLNLATPAGGTAPTNTVDAIIDILKYPNANVAALYNLAPAVAPFQPALPAPPSDWTLPILAVPAAPTFSIAAGSYAQAQSVTLSSTTSGSAIFYTLDGSTPTTLSYPYSSAIQVSASETVKAVAVLSGRSYSSVASAAYSIAQPPASIVAVGGNNQSTPASTFFPSPLQVQVLDAANQPVGGSSVFFAQPTNGAGVTLATSSCTTDNHGLCSIIASANQTAGGPYTLTASIGAIHTTFSLTNTALPATPVSNNFVVTVTNDTSTGVAGNCIDQSTGSHGSNANCSLRDALQAATQYASVNAPAIIRFAQTAPATITLSHGNLNIASYTTLQGATSGTGQGLTNLITLDANNNSPVFIGNGGTQAVFNNLIFTHGNTGNLGGGLYMSGGSVTINSSTFLNNNAGYSGGAISNSAGTLTINNSTFLNNQATSYYGGAIDNFGGGTLLVNNSTFTGNSAGTDGGAIYTSGPATITASTIAGNTAPFGGGLFNKSITISITNSILTGNTNEDCGGLYCAAAWVYVPFTLPSGTVSNASPLTIAFSDSLGQTYSQTVTVGEFSTIYSLPATFGPYFSQNTSGLDTAVIGAQAISNILVITPANGATLNPLTITNATSFVAAQQTYPFLLANNHNVFGVIPAQASYFGLTSANAGLGALANNGGPTQTMLPLTGSAALCAITPSNATGADQRGQPRTVTVNGSSCQDAGSVQTAQ